VIAVASKEFDAGDGVGAASAHLRIQNQIGEPSSGGIRSYLVRDGSSRSYVYRSFPVSMKPIVTRAVETFDPERVVFRVFDAPLEGSEWVGVARRDLPTVREELPDAGTPDFESVVQATGQALTRVQKERELENVQVTFDGILTAKVGRRRVYVVDPFPTITSDRVLPPHIEMGVLLLELHRVLAPRHVDQAPDAWSVSAALERLYLQVAARFSLASRARGDRRREALHRAEYLRFYFELSWQCLYDLDGDPRGLDDLARATMEGIRAEMFASVTGAASTEEGAGQIFADENFRSLHEWLRDSNALSDPLDRYAYVSRRTREILFGLGAGAATAGTVAANRRFFQDYGHRWSRPNGQPGSWGPLLSAFAAIAPDGVFRFMRIHGRAQRHGLSPTAVRDLFARWRPVITAAAEAAGGGDVGSPAWRAFETAPTSRQVAELGYAFGSLVLALQRVFDEVGQTPHLRFPTGPEIGGVKMNASLGNLTVSRLARMAALFLENGSAQLRPLREVACRAFQIDDDRLDHIVEGHSSRLDSLIELATEIEFFVIDRSVPALLDAEIRHENGGATTLARLVRSDQGEEAIRIARAWFSLDLVN